MKKLFVLALFLLPAFSRGGELDRFIEYDINRRYEDRRAAARAQLDAVVDQGMEMQMRAKQQRMQQLAAAYNAHPCFETEKALIDEIYSMRGMFPSQVAEYWHNIRVCCEKYGIEYDDTAEREELAEIEERQAAEEERKAEAERRFRDNTNRLLGKGGKYGGTASSAAKHKHHKPPKPTTKEVVDMAEKGIALGEKLGGGPPVQNGERDAPSSRIPERHEGESNLVGLPPVLRPGQKHPYLGHVVLSSMLEWEPEAGYDWNAPPQQRTSHGDWIRFGVHWVPGSEHPEHPHVVAGDLEGSWEAAEGYRFLSHKWDDWRVVPE